jgi:hypothetical protein
MNDLKKLQHLVESYGRSRVQEELAGLRDAPESILKRHHDAGKAAWDELTRALEVLIDRAGGIKIGKA